MKIVRHIAANVSEEERRELQELGAVIPKMGNVGPRFIAFDVAESDAAWPAIRTWFLDRGKRPGWEHTEFRPAEVRAAHWVTVDPDWHHGYPQPEDDFAYRAITYDLSEYCDACGVGARQAAPFRMTGEPKWGRRSVLQLNWVFDEYFATPNAWEEVFEPFGIAARPVVNRRGRELTTVVQLVNEERVSMTAAPDLPGAACTKCGRWRYEPITRGPLRQLLAEPTTALARTSDWFGSGFAAHNYVLASQALVTAIEAAGLKGVSFRPVAIERWIDPSPEYIDQPADPQVIARWLDHLRAASGDIRRR